jgi:CRP-like cAMP-binding protein
MKDRLTRVLRSFSTFSEEDIAMGMEYMRPKTFEKDTYLIEAGHTCDWLAFVYSGVVRNYYISSKEEEVTYCLTLPNTFISAYASFIQQKASIEYIHALAKVEALFLHREDLEHLTNENSAWLKFSKYMAEQSYLLMENRMLKMQMESAECRYHDLITTSPEVLHQVPLNYIASYLGISQRHLSRMRRNLSF